MPDAVKPPGKVIVGLPLRSKGAVKRNRPAISLGSRPEASIIAQVCAANVTTVNL